MKRRVVLGAFVSGVALFAYGLTVIACVAVAPVREFARGEVFVLGGVTTLALIFGVALIAASFEEDA